MIFYDTTLSTEQLHMINLCIKDETNIIMFTKYITETFIWDGQGICTYLKKLVILIKMVGHKRVSKGCIH